MESIPRPTDTPVADDHDVVLDLMAAVRADGTRCRLDVGFRIIVDREIDGATPPVAEALSALRTLDGDLFDRRCHGTLARPSAPFGDAVCVG